MLRGFRPTGWLPSVAPERALQLLPLCKNFPSVSGWMER